MCGCGIREPCDGSCSCGCRHDLLETTTAAYEHWKWWAECWEKAYGEAVEKELNIKKNAISLAIREHLFAEQDIPEDECDCCAEIVIAAVCGETK